MSFLNPWQQDVPWEYRCALRRHGLSPTRLVLAVSVQAQSMVLWENHLTAMHAHNLNPAWTTRWHRFLRGRPAHHGTFVEHQRYSISTSKFGLGQEEGSNGTPLGLHLIARKIGGGRVLGTVFEGRRPIGNKWRGMPTGRIMHRILWLAGLEPGYNQGGSVDTFRRYVYIHGCGEERTLGRPDSHGCVHVAMDDLLPLFDQVDEGTHVWIGRR